MLVEKELSKKFAIFPRRLYNGGWIWWKPVYHRSFYTDETVGLLEPPPTIDEYYTPEEAAILKLRG